MFGKPMNTIIEFTIYAIAALALITVPLILIAGGLASRSLDYSAADEERESATNSNRKGE